MLKTWIIIYVWGFVCTGLAVISIIASDDAAFMTWSEKLLLALMATILWPVIVPTMAIYVVLNHEG
jgi:hypothetical protein